MKWIFFLVISFFFITPIKAIVVGSNSAVSYEAHTTFPVQDDDNTMYGFGWFANGFRLENAATTCIFDSILPVSGVIYLSGGILYLQKDLRTDSYTAINSMGSIYGNNHFFDLSPSVSQFIVDIAGDDPLALLDSLNLGQNVNSVDWSYDDQYVAVGIRNTADGHQLKIYYFDGVSLTLTASADYDGGNNLVWSVRWHPSQYYVAVGKGDDGSLPWDLALFYFNVSNGIFSNVFGKEDITYNAVSWSPNGDLLAAGRDSVVAGDAEVELYRFSEGTLTLMDTYKERDIYPVAYDREVQRSAMDFDPTGSYLAVGFEKEDGTGEHELLIFHINESLALTVTASVDVGKTVRALDWSPTGTFIAVGLSAGTKRIRVYSFITATGVLLQVSKITEGVNTYAIDWDPNGEFILAGRDSTEASELVIYSFDKISYALSLVASLNIGSDTRAVRYSHGGEYFASGSYDDILRIFSVLRVFDFNNLHLFLNSNLLLNVFVDTYGDCVIDGRGNTLQLGAGGGFRIRDGQLTLQNLKINAVARGNFVIPTSETSLLLRDVEAIFEGNFVLSAGSIFFDRNVLFTSPGGYGFCYESSETSTIGSHSTLFLDKNMTFSYNPPVANKALFEMNNITSKLRLKNCTLSATTTGLQLTKGTLQVIGSSYLSSDATVAAEGIVFGDGTSANNLRLQNLTESELELLSGYLVNENVE